MDAQKHIVPILIIIVVLVALLSTYAWFMNGSETALETVITTGVNTVITVSDYNGTGEVDKYTGQSAYHEVNGTYVAYDDTDAPYVWSHNQNYQASAEKDITITFELTKVVITPPEGFSKSLNWILTNAFGHNTTSYTAQDFAKYLSSTINDVPANNDTGYYMVGSSQTSITNIVLTQQAANNYFCFSYRDASTLYSPIRLTYVDSVPNPAGNNVGIAPSTHTATLFIGYYGKVLDSGHQQYNQYVAPFIFSATQFSGSTFAYTIMASGS